MSHPILRNLRSLYFYFLIWLGLAVIHASILGFNQRHLNVHDIGRWLVLESLVFNGFFAAIAIGLWYPCKYISIEKERIAKVVLSHLSAAVLTSVVWLGMTYGVLTRVLTPPPAYELFLKASLPWRFLIGLLLYLVMASFYYAFIYAGNLKEQQRKEAELQALIHEAELRSLKLQINPHFIFNSLNSINSLTMSDPARAGEMTIKLASFLRYTLSKNERQMASLDEEIESVRLYLDIEKIRFGDKIQYLERIENGCRSVPAPSMILQPLFENAIKHGVYESLEPVRIELCCEPYGDYVKATVENTVDRDAVSRKGEGIGLRNIRERLQRIYDQDNLLQVEKNANNFKVTILLPKDSKWLNAKK